VDPCVGDGGAIEAITTVWTENKPSWKPTVAVPKRFHGMAMEIRALRFRVDCRAGGGAVRRSHSQTRLGVGVRLLPAQPAWEGKQGFTRTVEKHHANRV